MLMARQCVIKNVFFAVIWYFMGFPGKSVGKASASNAGDLGSIPGLGRSPGERNGNPLQYSFLESPMEWDILCIYFRLIKLSDLHPNTEKIRSLILNMYHEIHHNIFFLKDKISQGMRTRDCMEGMRVIKRLFSSFQSLQFSLVQSCVTLCNPMNRTTPGLSVHHQLPEFTQTHIHRVSDAIQPSHPLSSPSPPAPNPSQHQGLFQWVNSLHEVAKVLEFQPLSPVQFFMTPWTAAHQASPSVTNSRNMLKLINSVIPSNHLIFCHPFSSHLQSFPAWGSLPVNQLFTSGVQSIGVSVSTSVLPMNIQDWFPLQRTSWISLQSKGISRVFSNTTVQRHQFFSTQLSL